MSRSAGSSVALLAVVALGACSRTPEPVADLIVINGDVRTMDPAHPAATALVVTAGRIDFVGSDADARRRAGPDTKVIDARGSTVLPGLIDSHIHAAEGALARGGCSLADKELSIEAAAPIIKACFAAHAPPGLLVVTDVNPADFKASRKELDAIERARPLLLWGTDGHTGWANSRALELAEITRATHDPEDGRIERGAKNEPTGFLVDGAVSLVLALLPEPTPEKRIEKIRWILPQLHAVGITSIFEANTDADTVAAFAELARRKQLDARVTIALESEGDDTPEEFRRLEDVRKMAAGEPLLRADFIKLFADGVLEYPTQTAALLAPYLDAQGKPTTSHGSLYVPLEQMKSFIEHANEKGFNIHVHAIGDAAVRETLDAFAAARSKGNRRLFSIAHLQLIDPADLPRFAQLNVVASYQLLWAQPDNYSVDAVAKYIGPERHARQYPARALRDAGGIIAGGSDWDVSSFNPFEAMAVAMSRRNPDHPERAPLGSDEALTLDDMLVAYTRNAAILIGRDPEVGTLAAGKAADFIVLDRKLTRDTAADEVRKTRPVQVFFAGRDVTPP